MKTIQYFSQVATICSILFITSCTKDFCEESICLNGGECFDGKCNCPESFTGTNCSEQRTPDKIRIRSIQVTKFPGLNNSIGWDATDGPDLYFRLYEGINPLSQPLMDIPNANDQEDYHFFIEIIDLRNVFNEHTLELRDYDAEDADDILGEVKFIPYYSTNGFPESMILDNGQKIAFNVELQYMFNIDEQ